MWCLSELAAGDGGLARIASGSRDGSVMLCECDSDEVTMVLRLPFLLLLLLLLLVLVLLLLLEQLLITAVDRAPAARR